MKFTHTTTLDGSFDERLAELVQTIENHQFKVLHIHDVQETLAGKNIEHGPYSIVEFCRAPAAKQVLDISPLIGLFLPCRAVIYQTDTIHIAFMHPEIIKEFFPENELDELIKEVDNAITTIIQSI